MYIPPRPLPIVLYPPAGASEAERRRIMQANVDALEAWVAEGDREFAARMRSIDAALAVTCIGAVSGLIGLLVFWLLV